MSEPDLTVVLVTPDQYQTLRAVVRHLRAQTARDRLEIVIVAPAREGLGLIETDLEGFVRFRVVEAGTPWSLAKARADGIRAASAPVVALVEDHCFPDPGWAAALIAAHRQPWAAVGPAIANANPRTRLSWANLLIAYGRWVAPEAGAEVDDIPGNNSSYKRALLLEYGSELERMLEREAVLHEDLRAKGHRFYLEPQAKAYHQNASRLTSAIWTRFQAGRLFGAMRARNGRWSLLRRLLYIGGAPLIPLMHLRPVLQHARRAARQRPLLPGLRGAVVGLLAVAGAGEMIGYAFGPGKALQQLTDSEFQRERQLTKRDRQEVTGW
jgi:GT2 family glycosyltransferase